MKVIIFYIKFLWGNICNIFSSFLGIKICVVVVRLGVLVLFGIKFGVMILYGGG